MKVLIIFKKAFTVVSEGKKNEIQPGQYFAEVIEGDQVFSIRRSDFQISLSRDDWNRGKFFIENEISLRYFQEIEF